MTEGKGVQPRSPELLFLFPSPSGGNVAILVLLFKLVMYFSPLLCVSDLSPNQPKT